MTELESLQRSAEDLVLAIQMLDNLAAQRTWHHNVFTIPDYSLKQRSIAISALKAIQFDHKRWAAGYHAAARHLRKGIKSQS